MKGGQAEVRQTAMRIDTSAEQDTGNVFVFVT